MLETARLTLLSSLVIFGSIHAAPFQPKMKLHADNKKMSSRVKMREKLADGKRTAMPGSRCFIGDLGYSYSDFNYNSIKGDSYRKYNGNTHIGTIGGSSFKLHPSLTGGLRFLVLDTNLTSSQFIAGSNQPERTTDQNIQSYLVSGNLTKQLNFNWSVNLDGTLGTTRTVNAITLIDPNNPANTGTGNYKVHGNLFNVSITPIYTKFVKQFILQAMAGGSYTRVNQDASSVTYTGTYGTVNNPSFRNSSVLSNETVIVKYLASDNYIPYVSAGLVQVLSNTYNQKIGPATNTGPLPQLVLDSNGVNVGVGAYFLKGTLQVGYQYTNRGPFYNHMVSAIFSKQFC